VGQIPSRLIIIQRASAAQVQPPLTISQWLAAYFEPRISRFGGGSLG
jgi:hypothetical protein